MVAGSGILAGGHWTVETLAELAAADRVFYLTADPATEASLRRRRPDARSLYDCYAPGRRREASYERMLARLAVPLARGERVVAVFYGHPGVFAWAPHEAVRRARAAGCAARMLPAISAEDCLIADLELDPAATGWQSYEASDFLLRPRRIDAASALVLWQIGAVGVADFRRRALWNRDGLTWLRDRLLELYPAAHEAVLYEAAQYAICAPRREALPLARLGEAEASVITTLYVPPASSAARDERAIAELGLAPRRSAPRRAARSRKQGTPGSLSVVGLGYGAGGQVTLETRAELAAAGRVDYLLSDVTTAGWLRTLRPDARSLADAYRAGEDGLAGSRRMVARLAAALARGGDLCVAFSGHPGLYLHTSHAALAAARALGAAARLLPAVSCEDALVADLGLDPAPHGRLLYEATDFLARPRRVDPTAMLVLLQPGAIGERAFRADGARRGGALRALARRLAAIYGGDRELVLYRSPRLPWLAAEARRLPISRLGSVAVPVDATLVVPPRERAAVDAGCAARFALSAAADSSRSRSARSAGRRARSPRPD